MLVYLYLDTQEFSTEQIPILFEHFDFQKKSQCVCEVWGTESEKKTAEVFLQKTW